MYPLIPGMPSILDSFQGQLPKVDGVLSEGFAEAGGNDVARMTAVAHQRIALR